MTGAPVPPGADVVVMIEKTSEVHTRRAPHLAAPIGSQIRIEGTWPPEKNIARRGSDLGHGQPIVGAGTLLGPAEVGVLAAVGCTQVPVRKQPALAILSSGDEIVERPFDNRLLTEQFTAEAAGFIRESKDRPFFLYFSPLAVHVPVTDVPQEYLDRVPPTITGPTRRALGGTLIAFDDAVGTILDSLEENGLAGNTFVFFTSDNGGELQVGACNDPWSGGKATYREGGFRVPTAVRWPGRIPAGTVYPGLASSLDILPTFVAVAVGEPPMDRDERAGDADRGRLALPHRGSAAAARAAAGRQRGPAGPAVEQAD